MSEVDEVFAPDGPRGRQEGKRVDVIVPSDHLRLMDDS